MSRCPSTLSQVGTEGWGQGALFQPVFDVQGGQKTALKNFDITRVVNDAAEGLLHASSRELVT